MKKGLAFLLATLMVLTFGLFALGSGDDDTDNTDATQANGTAETTVDNNASLGDYVVEIKSCRLTKDYEGSTVAIITYGFTNNSDSNAAFYTAFTDEVFQNGVGLNKAYVLASNADYNSDNQTKNLQPGASLDVEVAYKLNDETTDIVVEVSRFISLDDSKVTRTFSIA